MIPRDLFDFIGYAPHVGQARFHDSDSRFKILIAGARFGKSLASARDVLSEILSGGTHGWLVGPTYALARPEFEYIRADMGEMGAGVEDSSRGFTGPGHMITDFGASARCLSAHLPESLLGREIDWLILCEGAHIDRDAFERFLRARLATRSGRLIVPTTPHGRNWIHALYNNGLENEDWSSFRNATWDNPRIPSGEIESARKLLPPETFDEQYAGAFTSPAGRVYREFEPERHVARNLAPTPGSVIYKAIDFGYTNPFACLWGALDGDGRLLVLREHYQPKCSLDKHASAIHAVDAEFEGGGCHIGACFADPSGALERRTLGDLGIRTTPADNRLTGGIDIVRRRLGLRDDDTPGVLIDSSCVNLIREFDAYEWEDSSCPGERAPRKVDDHALDALRYLCVAMARQTTGSSDPLNW